MVTKVTHCKLTQTMGSHSVHYVYVCVDGYLGVTRNLTTAIKPSLGLKTNLVLNFMWQNPRVCLAFGRFSVVIVSMYACTHSYIIPFTFWVRNYFVFFFILFKKCNRFLFLSIRLFILSHNVDLNILCFF